jgi:hypothetical protein
MNRCIECRHFIKTYEDEGWCSHSKYAGFVAVKFNDERCQGHGFVRESELRPLPPSASVETPHRL